jgi:hypothetical protein
MRGNAEDLPARLRRAELIKAGSNHRLAGDRELAKRCLRASPGIRKAEPLGEYVMLSDEARTRLGIRTIGAHDVSKRARTMRVKAKRRERDAARRLARGMRPQSQSLAQTRPWEAEGISRRQWYLNRKTHQVLVEVTDSMELQKICRALDFVTAGPVYQVCTDSHPPSAQIPAPSPL